MKSSSVGSSTCRIAIACFQASSDTSTDEGRDGKEGNGAEEDEDEDGDDDNDDDDEDSKLDNGDDDDDDDDSKSDKDIESKDDTDTESEEGACSRFNGDSGIMCVLGGSPVGSRAKCAGAL